ncbi:MAG: prephenate dehydrogenase [Actinobacteria bacterium]|nr:prephenate dehydrogenase [Actinomycetota bacterium]
MSSTTPTSPFRRVTVVGCGLVGGSVALATAALPGVEEVVVSDVDAGTLARAAELGIGSRHEPDAAVAVDGADLVVLCTPVGVTGKLFLSLVPSLGPRTVVTDVGSVKSQVLVDVEGSGRRWHGSGPSRLSSGSARASDVLSRFIGGHPMAGSERTGVEAADGTLFQGATWILTPTAGADVRAFEELSAFLRALGARVLAVEPALHDRLVAIASHLPQVLASTLMDEAADAAARTGEAVLTVAAGGFRDATRVAGSDPDLWVGILTQNRDAVLEALDGFLSRLHTVRDQVDAGDWDGVRGLLTRARAARERLPSKERAGRLVDLVIPISDQPGVLAEVTTALGEAGVNIEDLAMRHATTSARGALLVAVDGDETADRALALLRGRGITAHLEPR